MYILLKDTPPENQTLPAKTHYWVHLLIKYIRRAFKKMPNHDLYRGSISQHIKCLKALDTFVN